MKNCNSIALGCWNIDGLFSRANGQRLCKFDSDVFTDITCKLDIICLIETHCSPQETLSLNGYQIYQKHRPKSPNSTKHFGGIAACVKDEINKGVNILTTSCTEILWIKLSRSFFNLETYICPANSSFSSKNDNIFEILESNVAEFSQYGNCLVCGDFNARTNLHPDYCSDDSSNDFMSLPDDYIYDIPLRRNNLDKDKLDDHGKQLLSFCKTTGLRILNGRMVGDLLGHCKCYSHTGKPSVIDYMFTSVDNLKNINFFHVHDPTEISIHTLLSTNIRTTGVYTSEDLTLLTPPPMKLVWSKYSDIRFQMALNNCSIQTKISEFCEDKFNTSDIDKAVD